MGARHKMARTLLTVMAAAAALCLAGADPTPATTTGHQILNLDDITGTWWAYVREGKGGSYDTLEMEITKKTPEEVAVYEQTWLRRNVSRIESNQDFHSDAIDWQNISLHVEFKFERLNYSDTFLIQRLNHPSYIKIISMDGRIELRRVTYTGGKLIFRDVRTDEYNFYRTLPDLATYARCEDFDIFDASDAVDADFLVGVWDGMSGGTFLTLRVTRITPEEVSAYRDNVRNTTIDEADIDWTKVRLHAELFSFGNWVRANGLIEDLNKPGSIRVIPLKETWDYLGMREVDNWFTSQNLFVKKDDEFLAIRNCHNLWEKAYCVRRPQISSR